MVRRPWEKQRERFLFCFPTSFASSSSPSSSFRSVHRVRRSLSRRFRCWVSTCDAEGRRSNSLVFCFPSFSFSNVFFSVQIMFRVRCCLRTCPVCCWIIFFVFFLWGWAGLGWAGLGWAGQPPLRNKRRALSSLEMLEQTKMGLDGPARHRQAGDAYLLLLVFIYFFCYLRKKMLEARPFRFFLLFRRSGNFWGRAREWSELAPENEARTLSSHETKSERRFVEWQ